MIKKETVEIEGKTFIYTYSDKGMMIHGGFPEGDYSEAYDVIEREYTETDIPIEQDETTAEELLDILTGETDD